MKSAFLATVLVACPIALFAQNPTPRQAPAPAAPLPATTPGRFQLMPDSQGSMFLVDTATGRVWRYTRLVMDEDDPEIKKLIDQRFESRRNQRLPNGVMPTLDELRKIVTEEVRREYDSQNSPCHGTKACFIEIDRMRLSADGWTSEVVAK